MKETAWEYLRQTLILELIFCCVIWPSAFSLKWNFQQRKKSFDKGKETNKPGQRRKAGPVSGYFSRISVLVRWKTCVNAIFSPWNPDPLSLTPRGPALPLFCGFMRRTNFLGWRELFTNRCLWALNLAFDFGRNTSTLSEAIRDVDLRDFREMWLKHSRNNDKQKHTRKFLLFFLRGKGVPI